MASGVINPPKSSGATRSHHPQGLMARTLQQRIEAEELAEEPQAVSGPHSLHRDLLRRIQQNEASLHVAAAARWAAPTEQDVASWADANRWLSPENSPEPGKWKTSRAAYQREPMQAISDPRIREVVLPWSAQTGKTNCLLNGLGYYIHADPCPMMWISTTIVEVESFAKTRFASFRRDNPAIAERVLEPGPRKSTLDEWKFPGGRLLFRGSNSPVGLRSNPIRVLIMDEVDGYPFATGEGEPTMLARKRLQAYEAVGISKAILASTPASARTSRIWPAYLQSDQRKFFVPCPHCQAEQTLVENVGEFMATVRWDKTPDGRHLPKTAMVHCKECGAGWTERQRHEAVAKGRWIAQAPENVGIAGFWVNELYSPFSSLEKIVRAFLEAKDEPRRFQQWVNLVLGITWEDDTKEGETEW